jgi:hypothetical protein
MGFAVTTKLIKISLILLVMFVNLTAVLSAGSAQSQVELSESELVFSGLVGETLQRTVTLKVSGDPVFGLQFVVSDLVDPVSKESILSEQITLFPQDLSQLSQNQVITITITGSEKHGTFEGDIEFFYPDQPEGEVLSLHLFVNIDAVPIVDADVNSKNLTLFVEPTLFDLPYGRPEIAESSPVLGEVVLSLVQSGDSPANILNAKILAMQNSLGQSLPEQAVRVASKFPISLSGKDAATIRVLAQGKNLPSGEYSGTLLVNVENQPAPLLIPLQVQVKDGPIIALILLAAGPLVGVLFFYWNKDGKNLLDIQRRVNRLQSVLKAGKYLSLQDQQQIKAKLDLIVDGILNKDDVSEVALQLTDLEAFIKGQQGIGQQYLSAVQDQIKRLESIPSATTVRADMISTMEKIADDIETGNVPSWELVQNKMDNNQLQMDEIDQIIQEVNGMDPERRELMFKRLDEARNMDELRNIVAEGRSVLPRPIAELFEGDDAGSRPDWERFSLVLQWRRLAVAVVVYLFTLFVGWVTLYANAPTFGANREDYITLFLWGVASNVVGGQTVDLKSILSNSSGNFPEG